jgi:predicted ABC-type ATPase
MATDDGDNPVLYRIAGPNGAGKSTLYEEVLSRSGQDLEFVNADEMAKRAHG